MTKRRVAKQATAFLLIAVILVTMAILPQTTTLVIPQAQAFAQAIPFMIGAGILLIGLYLVACQGMTFDSVKDMQAASGYVWDNMTNDQRDIWMSSIEGQLLLSGMSLVDAIKNGISGEEIDMRSLIKKFVLSLGITEAAWDAFVKNLFAIQSTTAAFTMPISAYAPSAINRRYTGDMNLIYELLQTMPIPEGYTDYVVMYWNYNSGYRSNLNVTFVKSNPYIGGSAYMNASSPHATLSCTITYNGLTYKKWGTPSVYENSGCTISWGGAENFFVLSTIPILDAKGGIADWGDGTTSDRPAVLPSISLDKGTTIDWRETDKPYRVRVPTTFDGVVAPPSTLVIPTPPKELTIDDFIAELTDHIAAIGEVLAPPRDQADYREIMEKMRRYMEHINKRARDGAVTGSLLGQLAEILARLRQALQRLRQNGKTDEAVDDYVKTLTDALTDARELAKRLGYEEEEVAQPPPPEGNGFINLFPFCLPFDLVAMLSLLQAEPKAPEFIIPLEMKGVFKEELRISFDGISPIMPMVRMLFLLVIAVGLIKLTSVVIKW